MGAETSSWMCNWWPSSDIIEELPARTAGRWCRWSIALQGARWPDPLPPPPANDGRRTIVVAHRPVAGRHGVFQDSSGTALSPTSAAPQPHRHPGAQPGHPSVLAPATPARSSARRNHRPMASGRRRDCRSGRANPRRIQTPPAIAWREKRRLQLKKPSSHPRMLRPTELVANIELPLDTPKVKASAAGVVAFGLFRSASSCSSGAKRRPRRRVQLKPIARWWQI